MIPNAIRRVLSSIQKHQVRALLMGGQACVLYRAAEFSRDVDLAILAEPHNLARLRKALADLRAETIAVPPFDPSYLRRGHAIHFRCMDPEAARMRIDVISKMTGFQQNGREFSRTRGILFGHSGNMWLIVVPRPSGFLISVTVTITSK